MNNKTYPAKVINDVNDDYFILFRYYERDKNLPLIFCYDKSGGLVGSCYFCFSDFFLNNEKLISKIGSGFYFYNNFLTEN
jgi:hypothetical protein